MAPIRLGDGTGIDSVRLGDGTAIDEITVDGQTVFSAGVDIPASVQFQFRAEDFATPWPANIGGINMTINGLISSTFANGQPSVDGDGNDRGSATGPGNLPSNEQFTVAFTINYTGTNRQRFAGVRDGSSDFFISSSSVTNSGELELKLRDNSNNVLGLETNSGFNGSRHAVVITKTGNTGSDVEFYVDDMVNPVVSSVSSDDGFDHTNFSVTTSMGFFDLLLDGSPANQNADAKVGVFEFANTAYTQTEREEFVERRPEVS